MKILFVVNNYYASGNGLSASARRTVQFLKEAGEDVRVISGKNHEAEAPQPEYILDDFRVPIFDKLIQSHGYKFADVDRKVMEEAHPENLFCSVNLGGWRFLNNTTLRLWRDTVFNMCSDIQCPTQNVLERLQTFHFRARLHLISNGIIPDPCIRQDEEDPNRPFLVAMIGRLAVEKNQPTLIEALRYSRNASRIQLYFAGRGPETEHFKAKAMQLYEDGIIKYPPIFQYHDRQGLRELASRADLYIHCATVEVEGLSALEALQQGVVPVIAEGDLTATSQFALDDRSLFPAKDPKALAERIDYWLEHPDERRRMGYEYAQSTEDYDIRKSIAALIEMFRDAVENPL